MLSLAIRFPYPPRNPRRRQCTLLAQHEYIRSTHYASKVALRRSFGFFFPRDDEYIHLRLPRRCIDYAAL